MLSKFSFFSKSNNLIEVDLSNNKLNDMCLEYIENIIFNNKNLKYVDFSYNFLKDDTFIFLVKNINKNDQNIKTLFLNNNLIGFNNNENLSYEFKLFFDLKMKKVIHLNLEKNNFNNSLINYVEQNYKGFWGIHMDNIENKNLKLNKCWICNNYTEVLFKLDLLNMVRIKSMDKKYFSDILNLINIKKIIKTDLKRKETFINKDLSKDKKIKFVEKNGLIYYFINRIYQKKVLNTMQHFYKFFNFYKKIKKISIHLSTYNFEPFEIIRYKDYCNYYGIFALPSNKEIFYFFSIDSYKFENSKIKYWKDLSNYKNKNNNNNNCKIITKYYINNLFDYFKFSMNIKSQNIKSKFNKYSYINKNNESVFFSVDKKNKILIYSVYKNKYQYLSYLKSLKSTLISNHNNYINYKFNSNYFLFIEKDSNVKIIIDSIKLWNYFYKNKNNNNLFNEKFLNESKNERSLNDILNFIESNKNYDKIIIILRKYWSCYFFINNLNLKNYFSNIIKIVFPIVFHLYLQKYEFLNFNSNKIKINIEKILKYLYKNKFIKENIDKDILKKIYKKFKNLNKFSINFNFINFLDIFLIYMIIIFKNYSLNNKIINVPYIEFISQFMNIFNDNKFLTPINNENYFYYNIDFLTKDELKLLEYYKIGILEFFKSNSQRNINSKTSYLNFNLLIEILNITYITKFIPINVIKNILLISFDLNTIFGLKEIKINFEQFLNLIVKIGIYCQINKIDLMNEIKKYNYSLNNIEKYIKYSKLEEILIIFINQNKIYNFLFYNN